MNRQTMLRALACLFVAKGVVASVSWSKEIFPSPDVNLDVCVAGRICDPDHLLESDHVPALAEYVVEFENSHRIWCSEHSIKSPEEEDEGFTVQLAVAIVEKMDLSANRHQEQKEELAAEDFATFLHNKWGVGLNSPCGGTGIFIFVAIQDRALYVSRGSAVEAILTNARLDRVISQMKPLLRDEDYTGALQTAIELIGIHIQSGKPNLPERLWATISYMFPFLAFAMIALLPLLKGRIQQRRTREYARVQAQLSELDRNRAKALQGRYQCTSCAICLEEFPTSDDRVETSFSDQDSTHGMGAPRLGSDGKPLTLLRCGHVFDESCWTEWVETGQGDFSKCPVCNQDIGVTAPVDQDAELSPVRQRGALQEAEQRALRRYNQERNFRLARLAFRYPRFVNEQQVQRWSDPAYDRSLARDQSFVRSNPQQPKPSSRFDHGTSTRGFGGGMSSSGRGGRW